MNELIKATQRGDAKEFARILSYHPNPMDVLNRRDSDGWTITHHAASGNSTEIVSIVLEKGGNPLNEIPRGRNTPLHLALMSKEENSKTIADMLYKKAIELKKAPRANKEGIHPLHLAAKLGYDALAKSLLKQCPKAKNVVNANGMTPLGLALSNSHKKIVDDIIEVTDGCPTQFEDFKTIFRSYNAKAQKSLTPPVKIFVVGDNSSGKSTLIKSIQGEGFVERLLGVMHSTTDVPTNKVGLVPSDYLSKSFGKVIFYDLASGANMVHEDLLDSADDLAHSLFIIVVDNRPEKRVMEQRLEFWLSFILMQCNRFLTRPIMQNVVVSNTQPQQSCPNVLVVASFGEYHSRAFRNAPAVRLNLVVRSISRHNHKLTQLLNIVNSFALDCRKAESPPMTILRDELNRMCRELRSPVTPLHCRCYIFSEMLRQLEVGNSEYGQLPVMKLSNLASLVQQKSSETEPNLCHLLPQDSEEIHKLCLALEEIGRVILIPSGQAVENTWIVYGKAKVADKLDELFVNYVNKQHESTGSVALMTSEVLEECLQPVALNGMDLLTQLLECFKIHDNSVRGITKLPSEPPYFFFPTLLPMTGEEENWETDCNCFGWSIVPSKHDQLSRVFLPRFTKTLLLVLFQHCGDAREFEHRCLWSEGIHFQDKISNDLRQLEVTVIANSKAIILNMRFLSNIEIPTLQLRNMILDEIRSHKESIQPDTAVEESLIPKGGTTFPVRSPSMPRLQYPITELQKTISKSSLAFSLPPSGTSTPIFGVSQVSRSSGSLDSILEDLPFFEPCLHLSKLSLTNRLCLLRPDYINSELTDNFLRDFRNSIGPQYYKAIVDVFDLPIISSTPASSGYSSQISIVPDSTQQGSTVSGSAGSDMGDHLSFIDSTCDTFGKLVDCLDSISICNTVEVLAEVQKAQLSSNPPTPTPTDSSFPGHGQQHPAALLPPSRLSISSRSLYPHTTRSPVSSCSGVDLSGVHFVDSLEVITCGSPGGVFHSKTNNVTITIPEGAIPSDVHSVNVEFGVALLGPFDMPGSDVKPVSPFIWICTEATEFTFSKPITVILPHFISCDTEQDCEVLTFMKADHRYIDEEGKFLFKKCNGKSRFRPRSMKGTLYIQHSCFLCISSKVPSTTISNANYCLMMVMPSRREATFEVIFCITYLLETCMEVVSRQFFGDGFRIQRKEVKLASPAPDSADEAKIRINFQSVLGEGWVVANMSGHWEIPTSAIAFWNRDIDELRLLDRHKMYPPRFVIDVNGTSATRASCLTVEFTGLRKRVQFQITLSYPKRQRYSSDHSSLGAIKPGIARSYLKLEIGSDGNPIPKPGSEHRNLSQDIIELEAHGETVPSTPPQDSVSRDQQPVRGDESPIQVPSYHKEYVEHHTQSGSSLPHDTGQSDASIQHQVDAGSAIPKVHVPSYHEQYASEQPQSQDADIREHAFAELHGGSWYPQPSAPPYAEQRVQSAEIEYVQQSDPADDTGVHSEQPQIPQSQIQEQLRPLHEHPDHSDNRFLESPLGFGSWGQYRYLAQRQGPQMSLEEFIRVPNEYEHSKEEPQANYPTLNATLQAGRVESEDTPQGQPIDPFNLHPTLSSFQRYRAYSTRQPPDPQSAAILLTDAINRLDKSQAKSMFNTLLSESSGDGRFEVTYHETHTNARSPTFTLCIQVEFQKPQMDPTSIFLYDVRAEDTLHTLSLKVEQEFYIPKLSQNWIIGHRLVKGSDMTKTLKDFDIRGDGVQEVSLFMYVMHTKKAQVPHEAARMHLQQHRQHQQRDLTNIRKINEQLQHSVYLTEAEGKMGISFFGHCILECDCHGFEYTNKEHDITVRILEGAVPDGETVHIEFAVAMYGPFHFPENTRLISPILWLCLKEKNARLEKPAQIVLPHVLDRLTEEKAKNYQVGFAKVHHNAFYITAFGQPIYNFQSLASEGSPLFSTIGEQNYGLLKTNHFCYLCMTAKRDNPKVKKDISYCLTRIQLPLSQKQQKALFCVSYHLPTCVEAMEQQFPDNEIETSQPFNLKESPGSIRLLIEEADLTVAMEPSNLIIFARDVDFMTKDIDDIQLMHKTKSYPPRIKMTFATPQHPLKIHVRVEGTSKDEQLSADFLLFPFGDSASSLSPVSRICNPQSQKVRYRMEVKPTLRELELLKYTKEGKKQKLKILDRIGHSWRKVANFLSDDPHRADNLEQTYDNNVDCLRQLFLENFIDKKPASDDYSQDWKGIIELLNDIDLGDLAEVLEDVINNFY